VWVPTVPFFAYTILFLFLPAGSVLIGAFEDPKGGWTFDNITLLFHQPYIHAYETSIEVSGEWAVWLGKHRVQLREINMLTGSRFVEVTADFVRRFAELEGVMRVYTEAAAFDAALADALAA